METSDVAATAAADEVRRLEEKHVEARRSGDWRAELDAAADLLGCYMDKADVLGIDDTIPRFEQLVEEIRARVDATLASTEAPLGADDRAELERTKVALGAAVQSFNAFVGAARLRAATGAFAAATAAGDFARASEAIAAVESASQGFLAGTEGPTDEWPAELREKQQVLRDQAAAFIPASGELAAVTAAREARLPLPAHPRQIAARLKLIQLQPEVAEARRRVAAIRAGLNEGSLRQRALKLVALALAVVGVRMLARVERSYARTAAERPRSAVLFERAREHGQAATAKLEDSEMHRQASRAALDAPTASPAVASVVQFVFGWLLLGVALTANYFVFAAFDVNYFRWFLENGALISLVFGFVSLAVQLDDYPDLVSSNPLRYVYACWTLNFHLFLAWNQVISVDPEEAKGVMLSKVLDTILALLAMLAVTVAFVGWLLVVAPVQHIAYSVLGAPARNALRNPAQPRYDRESDKTIVSPEGAAATGRAIGYFEKPVALTSALTAAVLWIVSQLT